MAYVRQVDEAEATGVIARIYEAARKRVGSVAGIIRVTSLDGRSTQGSLQFYTSLMKSANALSAPRRELIGAVVSNVNDCYY